MLCLLRLRWRSHSHLIVAGARAVAIAVCYLGTPQTPIRSARVTQAASGYFFVEAIAFIILPVLPYAFALAPALRDNVVPPLGVFSSCPFLFLLSLVPLLRLLFLALLLLCPGLFLVRVLLVRRLCLCVLPFTLFRGGLWWRSSRLVLLLVLLLVGSLLCFLLLRSLVARLLWLFVAAVLGGVRLFLSRLPLVLFLLPLVPSSLLLCVGADSCLGVRPPFFVRTPQTSIINKTTFWTIKFCFFIDLVSSISIR